MTGRGRGTSDVATWDRGRHTRPGADVVLAIAPPYQANPWLGAGIPVIATLLEAEAIGCRVVRLLDDPEDVPADVFEASLETLWTAPTVEERARTTALLAARHDAWFEAMVDRLVAYPERVFGFSVWRHNADVTLELARRLRARRPDAFVVLGGPEAIDVPGEIEDPSVDVIVGTPADALAPIVFRALLDGQPEELDARRGIWLAPRHRSRTPRVLREPPPIPAIPPVDYEPFVHLVRGGREPSVPVVMNVGCPFRCGFCTNTTLYPTMQWGVVDKTFAEIDQIVRTWAALHPGTPPALTVELCDATMNADPEQFDQLCERVAVADWPLRPEIHGCFIVDGRITAERVRLFARAGISRPFFGLETASPRLRRTLKKPGLIESVTHALEHFRDAGGGRMSVNFNVIVGLPDETEAEFGETVRFLEWAAMLGVVSDVSVMPLSRSDAAMDRSLLSGTTGEPRGVRWVGTGPGGDPVVRARRVLQLFDHFAGILPITSVVPRDTLMRWMLPDMPAAFRARWLEHRGSKDHYFGEVRVTEGDAAPGPSSPSAPPHRLAIGTALGEWVLSNVVDAPAGTATLVFSRPAGGVFALRIEPRDDSRPAFLRTRRSNLTYLREWAGAPCDTDASLVSRVAALIDGA